MGETADSEKNDCSEAKVEKKEKDKHADGDEKGEEKKKDKKKKDKDSEGKKKKNPEDNKDPTKLKAKLEKIENKMQALSLNKEEILKLIGEAEKNAANPSADSCPPASA